MKETSKKILKVGLIIYAILTVISIIHSFDYDLLPKLLKNGTSLFSITTFILLTYIWDRGEEQLAKYGFIVLIISALLSIIYNVGYSTFMQEKSVKYIYDIIQIIISTANATISTLALFSLMDTKDSAEKLKLVTVLAIIISGLLSVLRIAIKADYNSFIFKIGSSISYIESFTKYAAIILYLINKPTPVAAINGTTGGQNIQIIPQNNPQQQVPQAPIQQPTQQPIPQAVQQTPVQQQMPQVPIQQPQQQVVPQQIIQQPVQQVIPQAPIQQPTQQVVPQPTIQQPTQNNIQ